MLRLLRLSWAKKALIPLRCAPAVIRDGSPTGASTFTTSAPRSARYWVQTGPETIVVQHPVAPTGADGVGSSLQGTPQDSR